MAKVQFPDGTTVQAVGIYERRSEHPDRDYGLSTLTRYRTATPLSEAWTRAGIRIGLGGGDPAGSPDGRVEVRVLRREKEPTAGDPRTLSPPRHFRRPPLA